MGRALSDDMPHVRPLAIRGNAENYTALPATSQDGTGGSLADAWVWTLVVAMDTTDGGNSRGLAREGGSMDAAIRLAGVDGAFLEIVTSAVREAAQRIRSVHGPESGSACVLSAGVEIVDVQG